MGLVGDMELVRDCKGKLEKVLDVYEERLASSKYLAGERFTIADLSHLPNTRFVMNEGGMEHLIKGRKNVYRWWMDISSRPSWKKVMELRDSDWLPRANLQPLAFSKSCRIDQMQTKVHSRCLTENERIIEEEQVRNARAILIDFHAFDGSALFLLPYQIAKGSQNKNTYEERGSP
ncbi:Glutathione S-transferase F11 [Sesamum angolense]|uniref:glutathione transferase n=1 Tax=Sesamum angolense TaxID=2727404 RepID=A0AAE1XDL2_9LAMI|nr:Glutathione S-transferase F11 [Sesamum angolense]